jgi:hypothetical protein
MSNIRSALIAVMALGVGVVQALAQPIGNDGWSVLTPSPDSRVIYVSNSTGNDNNSGLSESAPKKTLAAGFALLRNGYPDWLLLKSGDTWYESFPFWNRSGRSPAERMVVKAYGSGPRPRLLTGSNTAVHMNPKTNVQGVRNLVFADLHLNAHTNPGTAAATGFLFLNSVHNVLIENCYVENYRVNMIFQAFEGTIRQSNLAVRRNVIVDALATNTAHAQGIYAQAVDGLLMEENVFDMNGWSPTVPTANVFRHNIYIQCNENGNAAGCTDVVTRGNITARASATGFMQRTGGVVEDNLVLQNPIGIQFGYNLGPPVSGTVRNNVVLDSRDISSTLPRGMGLNITHALGVEIFGNIVAHQRSGTNNVQAIGVDGTYRNLVIQDNIVFDWNAPGRWDGRSLGFFGTAQANIMVRDNHFQMPQGGHMVGHYAPLGPAFTYIGNQYFSTNSGSSQFFSGMTYSQWIAQSGESESLWAPATYPASQRDIAAYMVSLGRPASLDAFMQQARQQARHNWRPEFTAASVNQWIRQGFGGAVPCYANCDGSTHEPILNVGDFVCFVGQFAEATSLPHEQQVTHYANCDGSQTAPVLNVEDFQCFLTKFAQGCP